MPASGRRKQPKAPAAPIDLEEMEQDPGFRGMLSFLDVAPEERAALLRQREAAAAESPMGESSAPLKSPTGISPPGSVRQPPMGEPPEAAAAVMPRGGPPMGQSSVPIAPYMDVEGRGKRPLRFCRTVQDGHTAGEHLAYQALWNFARRYGRAEPSGSLVVDAGLSQLCSLLASDHKNVKRLLGALQEKLAIDVARPPDYRLAIPTRYRVYSESQIIERRRAAGLVWVVRTRAVRFVDLPTVNRLLAEDPMSEIPMGEQTESPAGPTPVEFPAGLAVALREWVAVGDNDIRRIWEACRRGCPDCSEEEVAWFSRSKEPLIRSGRIENPAALLVRSVPQFFAEGGSAALVDYRRERAREEERERRRRRQAARMVLEDLESTEAEIAWAREILDTPA